MSSRLCVNPDRLFDVFVTLDYSPNKDVVKVNQVFPPDFQSKDADCMLDQIPKFAYPCKYDGQSVEHYSFVLTDIESKFHFGFCRLSSEHGILCIISRLPWFEVFYKVLNVISEQLNNESTVDSLLQALYDKKVPGAQETCIVKQSLTFEGPDLRQLPTIPANRNLTEYYSAVDYEVMIRIFANMLNERRVIITSKRLSRMTACCHASASLLYPMNWQHLFIPVLPEVVLEYVVAPMPFIVGVHSSLMDKVRQMEIGDAVIVNADTGEIEDPHNDNKKILPSEAYSALKKALKGGSNQVDTVSRAYLRAVVFIIGCYRDGLKYTDDMIEFDSDLLLESKSGSVRTTLESMLQLQTYQQFIEERLILLNSGKGFSDEFELEITKNYDKGDSSKYKEWITNMKKQGKKVKKQGFIKVSSMSKKFKEVSKKTYKDLSHKLSDRLKKDYGVIDRGGTSSAAVRPTNIALPTVKPMRPPRPNLQDRIKEKHKVTSPQTRGSSFDKRSSYDRALRKYNTLSFDDDDIHLSNGFNLSDDPDLQKYLQRSHSAEKFHSSDDGISIASGSSFSVIASSLNANSSNSSLAPPTVSKVPLPLPKVPPRKKRQQETDFTQGDNPGFEDSFIPVPEIQAPLTSTPAAGSAQSRVNTDLLGLDLSPAKPSPAVSSPWTKPPPQHQPNYHLNYGTPQQPLNPGHPPIRPSNPFMSPGDPIQTAPATMRSKPIQQTHNRPTTINNGRLGPSPASSAMVPPRPSQGPGIGSTGILQPQRSDSSTVPKDPLAELSWNT